MSGHRVVYEDEYCVVRLEPEHRLLTYTRKATRFPDLEASGKFWGTLGTLDVGGADRLLTDVRDAPPNNSPEWEALFQRNAGQMFAPFRKRATLVRSQVGKLQVERLSRGGIAGAVRVFHDEAAARRWLLE
jgi:hypothetical protein